MNWYHFFMWGATIIVISVINSVFGLLIVDEFRHERRLSALWGGGLLIAFDFLLLALWFGERTHQL